MELSAFINILSETKVFIGFDRDGTLVPYADHPDEALLDECVKVLLEKLSRLPNITVAIISARSIAQLGRDMGEDGQNLILAGNYGLEISFPDNTEFLHPDAVRLKKTLRKLKIELYQKLPALGNVIIEDHGFSMCVHYHRAQSMERKNLITAISAYAKLFPELTFINLPTSFEIMPARHWNKSSALDIIDGKMGFEDQPWRMLYFGDSISDEPAFQWINKRGGISVRIGDTQDTQTQSNVQMKSCSDLIGLLTLALN